MGRLFIRLGAVAGFIGVALGAFGAHMLRAQLSANHFVVFETGVHYQLVHALALVLVGVLMGRRPARLTAAAGWCFAQAPARPEPLPQPPPPPPPEFAGDPELEPQVTIIRRDEQVVEEVRIKGELRYVRVTPRHGRPYFLIPDGNGAPFIRRDSLDSSLKVPMWILVSF